MTSPQEFWQINDIPTMSQVTSNFAGHAGIDAFTACPEAKGSQSTGPREEQLQVQLQMYPLLLSLQSMMMLHEMTPTWSKNRVSGELNHHAQRLLRR